jgi:hypothetical protein
MKRSVPWSRLDGDSPGPLALVAWPLDPGVVPNADSVRAGCRQIRDFEVGAPGSSHASGHKRNALTDHGTGRVQGLCEDAQVQCVLAVPVINITADSGIALPLISSPFEGEVLLPAVHQSGGCHGQRRACAGARAGRGHRRDQARQEHESKGCHYNPRLIMEPHLHRRKLGPVIASAGGGRCLDTAVVNR